MVYITRRARFCAAHKLWNAAWSEEKNREVFGKCCNPHWHGHNYEVFVTLKGIPAADTGFVANLTVINDIIEKYIIAKVDHKNLNEEVDFLKNTIPSTENLCIAFWQVLHPQIKKAGAELHGIKISETENNFAEYYGE